MIRAGVKEAPARCNREASDFQKPQECGLAKGQKRSTREKKKPKQDKTKAADGAPTPSAGAIAALKWNKTPVGPKKKGA